METTIFLSFLGTNEYRECYYKFDDETKICTKYTQIAILQKHNNEVDDIFVFLTKDAKEKNWIGDGNLYDQLLKLGIPNEKIHPIDIPNGFDNSQLNEIFEIIVGKVTENAKLIIDVTHSFRSLPITFSSVLNYLKKVKNVQINHIYYGAFEVLGNPRDVDNSPLENRIAPMLDITYLSAIQDWSFAIDNFLKFGNITELKSLSKQAINPILRETAGKDETARTINYIISSLDELLSYIYACRSKDLLLFFNKDKGKIRHLIDNLEKITISNYLLPQLNEPFSKIKNKITSIYDENPIISTIKIVEWCIDFNWIQQGYTLLQENLITYLLSLLNEDYNRIENRKALSSAINIIYKSSPQETWEGDINKIKFYIDQKEIFEKFINDFVTLSDKRNDINHSGYRENPSDAKNISNLLKKNYQSIISLINSN